MGKTTLLQSMLFQLIREGQGVGVIDPHGDFSESVLQSVPRERIGDVILLDLTDPDFAPALNLVSSTVAPSCRPRVATALLAAFRHIWGDSWGPRLEYLLYHALRVLLDSDNSSLVALPRLFLDDRYRERLVKQCRDPFVCRFWEVEFAGWDRRYRMEAMSPVLNKLGQFVSNPALRVVLGQVRLKVDFRELMDAGKILILNLSKGHIGEDASRLLGALCVSFLAAQAMERVDTSLEERRPFTLFVDEAQNFLTDALASILSESRKYGLGMVLSHQYLDQLSPSLQSAVLGNVGTLMSFRVSAKDGEAMSREFGGNFPPQRFVEMPPYHAMLRPLDDPRFPFLLGIDPPELPVPGYRKAIVRRCRQQYFSPRREIEDKLGRWVRENG